MRTDKMRSTHDWPHGVGAACAIYQQRAAMVVVGKICSLVDVDRRISARPGIVPFMPLLCSHPLSCCSANDPESKEDAPVVLKSVVTAASPFSMAIRDHIENEGLDFSRTIMLLPHWLAIEMGWDFAISS